MHCALAPEAHGMRIRKLHQLSLHTLVVPRAIHPIVMVLIRDAQGFDVQDLQYIQGKFGYGLPCLDLFRSVIFSCIVYCTN